MVILLWASKFATAKGACTEKAGNQRERVRTEEAGKPKPGSWVLIQLIDS